LLCNSRYLDEVIMKRSWRFHETNVGVSNRKACHHCRRGKIACDKQRPCSNCVKKGKQCFDYDKNLIVSSLSGRSPSHKNDNNSSSGGAVGANLHSNHGERGSTAGSCGGDGDGGSGDGDVGGGETSSSAQQQQQQQQQEEEGGGESVEQNVDIFSTSFSFLNEEETVTQSKNLIKNNSVKQQNIETSLTATSTGVPVSVTLPTDNISSVLASIQSRRSSLPSTSLTKRDSASTLSSSTSVFSKRCAIGQKWFSSEQKSSEEEEESCSNTERELKMYKKKCAMLEQQLTAITSRSELSLYLWNPPAELSGSIALFDKNTLQLIGCNGSFAKLTGYTMQQLSNNFSLLSLSIPKIRQHLATLYEWISKSDVFSFSRQSFIVTSDGNEQSVYLRMRLKSTFGWLTMQPVDYINDEIFINNMQVSPKTWEIPVAERYLKPVPTSPEDLVIRMIDALRSFQQSMQPEFDFQDPTLLNLKKQLMPQGFVRPPIRTMSIPPAIPLLNSAAHLPIHIPPIPNEPVSTNLPLYSDRVSTSELGNRVPDSRSPQFLEEQQPVPNFLNPAQTSSNRTNNGQENNEQLENNSNNYKFLFF